MPDNYRTKPTMSPEKRYQREPAYAALVDLLEHQLLSEQCSPIELREAAELACAHFGHLLELAQKLSERESSDQ